MVKKKLFLFAYNKQRQNNKKKRLKPFNGIKKNNKETKNDMQFTYS